MSKESSHGLGAEHPRGHQIQGFCFILFFVVWILDTFVLKMTLSGFIPPIISFLLFCLGLIGAAFFIKASHDNVLATVPTSIVTDGVYGYLRHPMYGGTLLIYLSFSILSMSLISLIPLTFSLALYDIIASYEEKELENDLGSEYSLYKASVHRWFPLISLLRRRKGYHFTILESN
ncbi:MAG: methyltransferase family protein [Candidatus Thorarchaeota archaeon]